MPNNAKITLLGNLTKDPASRQAGNSSVVSFTVAVNTMNKAEDGSYQSDFYDVSVWGKNGEYLLEKIQKGTQVWVTGDFSVGSYTANDGQKRTVLRVTATDVRPVARMKGENAAPAPARNGGGRGYHNQSGGYGGNANDIPF